MHNFPHLTQTKKKWEVISMNMSVKCQVFECKHNDGNEPYCTLGKIEIVRHMDLSNQLEGTRDTCGTDCAYFERRTD